MARKSPIQMHHIRYGNESMPEWAVALKMWMHKAVTLLARMNATEEHYVLAVNFQLAINQIVNDMRMALDTLGPGTHASQKKHYEEENAPQLRS
jgi:hypothetical protein